MSNDKKSFSLKKGVIIPVPGTSKAYSDQNITDEFALAYLAKNPNRKALFSKVPQDLDKQIKALTEASTKNEGKGGTKDDESVRIGEALLSLEDALALLEKSGVTTQATTIKGVQKRVDGLNKEDSEKLTEALTEASTKNEGKEE